MESCALGCDVGLRLPPHTAELGYQKAEIESLGHKAWPGPDYGITDPSLFRRPGWGVRFKSVVTSMGQAGKVQEER